MHFPAGTEVEARHLKKRTRWRRAVLQDAVTPASITVRVKYVGETAVHPLPLVDLKFPKTPTITHVPEEPPKPFQVAPPVVEVIDVDSDSVEHGNQAQRIGASSAGKANRNNHHGAKEKGAQSWQDWLLQPIESEKMRKAREQHEARRCFTRPRTEPGSATERGGGGKPGSFLDDLMMQKRQLHGTLDQEKPLYAKVLGVEDKEMVGTKRGHERMEGRRNVSQRADINPYRQDVTNEWRRGPSGNPPDSARGQQEDRESWDVKRRRLGNTNTELFPPHNNSNARNAADDRPIERHPVCVAPEDLPDRIPRRHTNYESSMPRYSYAPPSWPPPGRRTEEFKQRDTLRPPIGFEEADGYDSGDGVSLPVEPLPGRSHTKRKGMAAWAGTRDVRTERQEQSVVRNVPQPKPMEQTPKRPPASRVATRYRPSGSPFLGSIDCDEEDTKILELCADMLNGGQVSTTEDKTEEASVPHEVIVRGKGRKSRKPNRWGRSLEMQGHENDAHPLRREEYKLGVEPAPRAHNVSFTSAVRSRCRAFVRKGFSAPFLVDCACGESDVNNEDREDAVQCSMCGLWSHLSCTQYAGTSSNVLEGKQGSRNRFMCLRCMDKLTMPVSSGANMTDSDSDDAFDVTGKNSTDGDDVVSVQIRSVHSILCQMRKRGVKKGSKTGDGESGENLSRLPLSFDEVEARVENIETLRSGICRPSTGERERNVLDFLTCQKQACS